MYKLLSCLLLGWLVAGCGTTAEEIINPSLVRVYLNNSESSATSVFIEDIKKTKDNGYLLIGVIGNSINTKFSRSAALYLLKIDAKGDVLWEKSYENIRGASTGFLSNVLTTNKEDEFVLVWNRFTGQATFDYFLVTFSATAKEAPTLTTKELRNVRCESNGRDCGFIAKITRHFDNTSYAFLSLAAANQQVSDGHIVFLSRAADSNDSIKSFSSRAFTGLSPGADALQRYESFLFVGHNNNTFYHNIPVNNEEMALLSAGNSEVYYRDSTIWAMNALNQAQGKLAVVFAAKNASSGESSYFAPSYNLLPTSNNSNSMRALAQELNPQFDGEKKVLLYTTTEQKNLLIGGSGNPVREGILIYALNENGNHKNINLANTNYIARGVAESQDGKVLVIAGNQKITPNWGRPFIILIPKTELLK